MKAIPMPTEVWEARTGQSPIKPEHCGHLVRDDCDNIVATLGKPTPREKIRTGPTGRKQAVRAQRRGMKRRGTYAWRIPREIARLLTERPHVRVARRQGAR